MQLRAYLVDDEPLAVRRLARLLGETGRVEVAGSATDPRAALDDLAGGAAIDVLFLDIHMPELDGFALLEELDDPPLVVFTTAHHEHALEAFRVLAIDYLLKPIDRRDLERALDKLDKLAAAPPGGTPIAELAGLVRDLARSGRYPERVASRLGDRIHVLELARVSCFCARDKLTYARVAGREYVVDESVVQLERRLDPDHFFRVHRSALLNLGFVTELRADAGAWSVYLEDGGESLALPVARDRLKTLRRRLGIDPP